MSANADVAQAERPELLPTVEAMFFVGGPPLTPSQLGELLDHDADQIVAAVAELNQRFARQGRPYEIRRVAAGYQMALRPQFFSTLRRLHGRTREVRLSLAAIEVLSLVAYRQPITTQEIESNRGVDSAAIVRQLRRRNLIQAVESTDAGQPPRYQTTRRFLDLFHLGGMDDLPRVQELEKA